MQVLRSQPKNAIHWSMRSVAQETGVSAPATSRCLFAACRIHGECAAGASKNYLRPSDTRNWCLY
jgi:hypothetical protein